MHDNGRRRNWERRALPLTSVGIPLKSGAGCSSSRICGFVEVEILWTVHHVGCGGGWAVDVIILTATSRRLTLYGEALRLDQGWPLTSLGSRVVYPMLGERGRLNEI